MNLRETQLEERLHLIANICRSSKHKEPLRDILRMCDQPFEIACPDCYGGHFRPCQMCGYGGRVVLMSNTEQP